jgi:hypothetical protein
MFASMDRERAEPGSAPTASRTWSMLWLGLLVLSACTSPSAPDPFGEPPPGTHQSSLFGVIGTGIGGVSVTSVTSASGGFAGTMRFRVRAKPDTAYFVQRAADLGRAGAADGVCQRAEGLPPWSAADTPFGPAFVTFPRPFEGELLVLTTDSRGEGARDFEIDTPQIPRGSRFDVRMRLVDSQGSPTSELRSGCMTIVVN